MIRILRIAVLGLFVVATVFSGVLFIKDKVTTDTTIPKITIEEEVLEVALMLRTVICSRALLLQTRRTETSRIRS